MMRRLMRMPIFTFAEAPQTIEGIHIIIEDINPQPSLTHRLEGMQDLSSLLPQKLKAFKQSPRTLSTCAQFSESQLLSDKS